MVTEEKRGVCEFKKREAPMGGAYVTRLLSKKNSSFLRAMERRSTTSSFSIFKSKSETKESVEECTGRRSALGVRVTSSFNVAIDKEALTGNRCEVLSKWISTKAVVTASAPFGAYEPRKREREREREGEKQMYNDELTNVQGS
jgi:hypothetical protein